MENEQNQQPAPKNNKFWKKLLPHIPLVIYFVYGFISSPYFLETYGRSNNCGPFTGNVVHALENKTRLENIIAAIVVWATALFFLIGAALVIGSIVIFIYNHFSAFKPATRLVRAKRFIIIGIIYVIAALFVFAAISFVGGDPCGGI